LQQSFKDQTMNLIEQSIEYHKYLHSHRWVLWWASNKEVIQDIIKQGRRAVITHDSPSVVVVCHPSSGCEYGEHRWGKMEAHTNYRQGDKGGMWVWQTWMREDRRTTNLRQGKLGWVWPTWMREDGCRWGKTEAHTNYRRGDKGGMWVRRTQMREDETTHKPETRQTWAWVWPTWIREDESTHFLEKIRRQRLVSVYRTWMKEDESTHSLKSTHSLVTRRRGMWVWWTWMREDESTHELETRRQRGLWIQQRDHSAARCLVVGCVHHWWGVVLGRRSHWWVVVVGPRQYWWCVVVVGHHWHWWGGGGGTLLLVMLLHCCCVQSLSSGCHPVHRCRVIARFCHHCIVSPSSIVVVVMLCHCLLVGQVRWVGMEVLTNGRGWTTNVSLSKINVKEKWDDVVGRKKGGKKKELRKEDNSTWSHDVGVPTDFVIPLIVFFSIKNFPN